MKEHVGVSVLLVPYCHTGEEGKEDSALDTTVMNDVVKAVENFGMPSNFRPTPEEVAELARRIEEESKKLAGENPAAEEIENVQVGANIVLEHEEKEEDMEAKQWKLLRLR